MAIELLVALTNQRLRDNSSAFTFQHKLHHDFESLIWVVVYAMTIRRRNSLAATDQVMFREFKEIVDDFWAGHSYKSVRRSHNDILVVGSSFNTQETVREWFPDPCEAAFFRDAMRMLRNQVLDGEFINYESLRALFKKHIQLAKELHDSNVAPNVAAN